MPIPPKRKKLSPTVADVATAAGVGKATAARALGRYGQVSAKVREKVFATAENLGYRPNELARSMTTGRSGTIGVVVGDIENPFFSVAVRGIADVAQQSGFTVVVANSGEEIDAEREAVQTLLSKRVDGMIVTPCRSRDIGHLEEVVRAGVPLVLMDRAVPELEVDTVTANDREAAIEATQLLLRLGHRRIAYVTACDTPKGRGFVESDIHITSVRERIDGFLHICREAGVVNPEERVIVGANNPVETHALVETLLKSENPPSAILASDSQVGLTIFEVVRDLGKSIPQDLSLITFHNADWTRVTSPPVTVIDQPVYQLGSTAASLMNSRLLGNQEPPSRIVLPSTLLERGSAGQLSIRHQMD